MVPWCHGQHDQPGIEPAPWVEHCVSSQMPLFLRSLLLFIGSDVHKRSIDPPSARLCSVLQLPPVAPSPRLDHQSRSSIAMFTVFLSHNEICSRHHFSPVTLKVWQNFHTEVSAALQPPRCCVSKTAPRFSPSLSLSQLLSKSLSERFKFRFNHFLHHFDHTTIAVVRHKSIGNERRLEGEWELSKSIDTSVSSF